MKLVLLHQKIKKIFEIINSSIIKWQYKHNQILQALNLLLDNNDDDLSNRFQDLIDLINTKNNILNNSITTHRDNITVHIQNIENQKLNFTNSLQAQNNDLNSQINTIKTDRITSDVLRETTILNLNERANSLNIETVNKFNDINQ